MTKKFEKTFTKLVTIRCLFDNKFKIINKREEGFCGRSTNKSTY